MLERFSGEGGKNSLTAALLEQRLVGGDSAIVAALIEAGQLVHFEAGQAFIEQGSNTNDVFFILSGAADIWVNGKQIAVRYSGDHVGEMSAIDPSLPRAATASARESLVALMVSADSLIDISNAFPQIWRKLASTLSKRLAQRNFLITKPRERVRVFVMSSAEAIPITRLLTQSFERDPFLAVVWNHGVFKASHYTLEDLENELDDSDFAIAIAHADDVVISRGDEWPTVRDNVVFELGMFIGRLGRKRAFLLEPRGADVKLPSDLAGLNTISYRYEPGKDALSTIAPACDRLRQLILDAGPKE